MIDYAVTHVMKGHVNEFCGNFESGKVEKNFTILIRAVVLDGFDIELCWTVGFHPEQGLGLSIHSKAHGAVDIGRGKS